MRGSGWFWIQPEVDVPVQCRSEEKLKTWAAKGKKFEYALPDEEWTAGQLRALETMLIGEALTGTKRFFSQAVQRRQIHSSCNGSDGRQ